MEIVDLKIGKETVVNRSAIAVATIDHFQARNVLGENGSLRRSVN